MLGARVEHGRVAVQCRKYGFVSSLRPSAHSADQSSYAARRPSKGRRSGVQFSIVFPEELLQVLGVWRSAEVGVGELLLVDDPDDPLRVVAQRSATLEIAEEHLPIQGLIGRCPKGESIEQR